MVERVPLSSGFCLRITQGETYVDIVPFGASIRSIVIPDRAGVLRDVCLGYEGVMDYAAQGGCLGSVVGRYANRIAGAGFTLNGRSYPLLANEGPNTLHGGGFGWHKRWWALEPRGEDTVVCRLDSPDDDEGFPGRVQAEVAYTWKDGALSIDYAAKSDADTVLNLTNHSYFNLAGQEGGEVGDHLLTLRAQRFTPVGPNKIVGGELRAVAGTAWDLRAPAVLKDRWEHPDLGGGFDHNYCLDEGPGAAATLSCPRTGIVMEMTTDQPGCQLYTAGGLSPRPGKGGAHYGPRHGVCLEAQNYPNAVNIPAFPSPLVKAGETWRSKTVYRFFVQ